MRMLSCLAPRDGGDLLVLGIDPDERPRELKRMLGVQDLAQRFRLRRPLEKEQRLVLHHGHAVFAIARLHLCQSHHKSPKHGPCGRLS